MPKNNILIAIDDPDWSNIIVHTVFNFIKKENTKITLLNVMETTSAEEQFFYKEPEKFIAHESKKANFSYIENFLESNKFEYNFIFEEGDAAENIINTAKNLNVKLVVVGSHNKKIFERLFLGSVAYKVLRLCPCSVMVVSSKYHIHNIIKKEFNVLLAINGSEPSLDATRGMVNLIDTGRTNLHILNVRVPAKDVIAPEAHAFVDMEKIDEEAKNVSNERLDKVYEILKDKGVHNIKKVSLAGKPANTIIEYSDQNSIDIIVMGSLGKKDLPTLLLGSTTSKVSERSEVPLIVVKQNSSPDK